MLSGLLAAALTALSHAPPATEGRVVDVRWDAPGPCPGEVELRRQVDEILGGTLAIPRSRSPSVIAVVRDEGETLSLRVFTVGEAGIRERALRYDRDCTLLTRAAAVVIAITIDPASIGRLSPEVLALLDPGVQQQSESLPLSVPVEERAPPEPSTETRAEVSPEPRTALPTELAKRPRRRARGSFRVLGGLGLGELPGAGGGVSGAATLVFHHLRLELVASLWPARRLRLAGADADKGADFLLWSLGPRLCGVLHPHRLLEVPLCAGFELGRVHVAALGLEVNRRARVTTAAGVFAPALVIVPLPRMALWLAPELVVSTRPTYSIADVGPIYQAEPVAGRFMAGIELRFP